MKIKILFRASLSEEFELISAKEAGFEIESSRVQMKDSLVIGRYSVLPNYKELENDLLLNNSRLINSYSQHLYVAKLMNWYQDFKEQTPFTWESVSNALLSEYNGPFVLKGETNSRKHLWKTHMFASSKEELKNVYMRLLDDSLIGQQEICVRKFEKFESCGFGIHELPITNEWRYFALNGKIIAGGFYWSEQYDVVPKEWLIENDKRLNFAEKIAKKIGNSCPFVVFDVAKREDGVYRLVELNDAQMSGISMIEPSKLYTNLYKSLLV